MEVFRLCVFEANMTGLISVIIPIHNTEKYLKRCIDSILDQTYTNWELLLINDGSTDGCWKICREYEAEYNNKIKYYEKRCGGPSDARNLGIEHARGEYLYFIDSDDYCEPNLLARACQEARQKQADVVIFGYLEHRMRRKVLFQYGKSGVITQKDFFQSLLQDDKIGNYIWNKFFTRELFEEIRFPVGEIFEDVSTVYKLIMKSKRISVINQPLYHYVKSRNSLLETLDEREVMQLYHAVRVRNQVIVDAHGELQELSVCNEVKYSIFIWNQIAKRYGNRKMKKYHFILNEIRTKRRLLKHLPVRYFIMGQLLCSKPEFYSAVLHLLRRKKYV